jgi:putative tryptophan/tyrosine transport system substrate-binding protein
MIADRGRRKFITLVSSAAAWPLATRAQQDERVRRIGVLMPYAAEDREGQARLAAFQQGLADLGWIDGRNLRMDTRWGAGEADRYRQYAAELVAFAPDVIVAVTSVIVGALQRETRSVPIVFVGVIDPVGAGLVKSLARPGGNITGFTVFEYGLSPKWLALLKEIAPHVTRALVFRNPTSAAQIGLLGGIQSVAPSLRVELKLIDERDADEIEHAVTAFAREPNGGQVVLSSPFTLGYREMIIALAARHRLPTVYTDRVFVTAGGLTSYGPNRIEQYRPAAAYVDRILKGAKPADLPVQAPTKYELVINLKTAKALGLEIPPTVLARADEVIE